MEPYIWNRWTGKTKPLERNRQVLKIGPNEDFSVGIDDEETYRCHIHEGRFGPSAPHEKTDERHVQCPTKKIEPTEFQSPSRSRNERSNHCPQENRKYSVGWSEEDT